MYLLSPSKSGFPEPPVLVLLGTVHSDSVLFISGDSLITSMLDFKMLVQFYFVLMVCGQEELTSADEPVNLLFRVHKFVLCK